MVAISPEDDGGRKYNDNQWHRLIATRKQALGAIIVDDRYHGNNMHTTTHMYRGSIFMAPPLTFLLMEAKETIRVDLCYSLCD